MVTVAIVVTVVGIVAVMIMGAVMTMDPEDLQSVHLIEVVEIILLGARLTVEGQEGNDPGHSLLMRGTMLVVVDRTASGSPTYEGKLLVRIFISLVGLDLGITVPINECMCACTPDMLVSSYLTF